MKLVDEKGKLFGLINVIDLAVILMVLAVGAGVVVKLVLPRFDNVVDRTKDVYVTVICRQRPESAAQELAENIGAALVARNDFSNGKIYSVEIVPASAVGTNADGIAVESEHPYLKDIIVVIKGRADPTAAVFTLGAQEMRIGYTIYVKTQRVEITGTIDDIRFE